MPILQFKGKNIIWNHHLVVPYHTLDTIQNLSFQPEKADGNLIVEGDNLLALKALLPHYAGRVKCIYIDPPYNTGNEGWQYNDNVNSPLMQDWLGKEVAKDDLTRHDKWLCMMTPRLKLLRELLADDGAIFISIDDNEVHHLRALMDEIFGEENFVATFPWRKRSAKSDVPFGISQDYEWIVCFSKGSFSAGIQHKRKYYYTPDYPNDGWRLADLTTQRTDEERPNAAFDIVDPKTGNVYPYNPKRVWGVTKDTFSKYYKKGKIVFPGEYDFLQISIPAYRVFESEDRAKSLKKYGTEDSMRAISTNLPKEVGMTEDGNKELLSLFNDKVFSFPKPSGLIKYLISILNSKDCIILDSFAGSGTTAQAVLDLNAEDGGNRKFILVQMSEATPKEPQKNICRDITRARVQRVIQKFNYPSGFTYQRVGISLDPESMLEGNLPTSQQLGDYLRYLCGGAHQSQPIKEIAPSLHFAGTVGRQEIYFIYQQDYEILTRLALNLSAAQTIKQRGARQVIVYAPACFLDEDFLREQQIEYVNLPYGMFQRGGA